MYAVIWVGNFSLQAVARIQNPATSHQAPLAATGGDAKKPLIVQINEAAQRFGVEIGMTPSQGQARCSQLELYLVSAAADAEAQNVLLSCARDVAPLIESTGPGICTIEVSGLAAENRSRDLARALCQLRAQGLAATAGIGATPLLALYAARETTSVRTVEHAASFLHSLPIAVAEPPPELVPILAGWGLTRLGQLTALSKADLARRLGTAGAALWDRARGGEPRPLNPHMPAPEFSASLDLEYEIETTEGVLFLLRRFVDRLALELRTQHRAAAEMTLRLKLADETTHERSFRLPEPSTHEDILFRTLHSYLESLQTPSAVVGVGLAIAPVRPLARQPGLFETGLRDPHGFAETLARVSAIVGSDQLGTPQLEDTHRPDAVVLTAPLPVVPPQEKASMWPSLGLPLRRFRPPLSVHVEAAHNGQPGFISGGPVHSPIAAVRGPWRSSGDWWKPENWSREEWDIELAIGGVYRLARIAADWYLDGEYE